MGISDRVWDALIDAIRSYLVGKGADKPVLRFQCVGNYRCQIAVLLHHKHLGTGLRIGINNLGS